MHAPVPKISIGMPVYNGAEYLSEAVTSLLNQSYTNFELIIADNASTDGTEEICRGLASQDPRIRYRRNPTNIGASPNFGLVLSLARGEYFKWACADDMHYPGNLERCVAVLDTAPPEVVLVVPRISLIDEKGVSLIGDNGRPLPRAGLAPGDKGPERLYTRAKTPHRRLYEVLSRLQWSTAQFGLFRTSAVRRTRAIDAFSYSDRVLLVETALLGEIWEIDEPLFARRQHPGISTTVHTTPGAYAQWMDPAAKGKALKRRILSLEYARSINRLLPPNPLERGLCLAVVARVWARHKLGNLVKRFKKC
jgi:glycosyltransferase involved in cell wall biosynthesis